MAKAHLNSVQKAIVELDNQKSNVEQEIQKLSEYLSNGIKELESNASKVEAAEEKKDG